MPWPSAWQKPILRPTCNSISAVRSAGRGGARTFDIGAFFWSEIDAWAGRILQQVHVLASAYGWSERDVLALSPVRRQLYLGMVGA